jgi:orotate phosphoribosyltransferase
VTNLSVSALIELTTSRRGHFRMESGYHSALWLDLDALFAAPDRVRPFVTALADALSAYRLDAVCGPLLGGAFLAQRVAEVLGAEFWYTEPASASAQPGLFRARYRLPAAFTNRFAHPRVALVDDVMSAGSSLRASLTDLRDRGIDVVAVGALLVLGDIGAAYFAEQGIPVEAVVRDEIEMWSPADCPQCARGVHLESLVSV